MKKSSIFHFPIVLLGIIISSHVCSQTEDSLVIPERRNIIKYNVSTPLLFGWENAIFGYEHVVNPKQTFSIAVGYRTFPQLINPDSSFLIDDHINKWGMTIDADYRFYFYKRNKFTLPDGLYWGPFVNYYHASFTNSFTDIETGAVTGNFDIESMVSALTVGVRLGYQLVIKDRFCIDLTFLGPAYALYQAKIHMEGDISVDEENEYFEMLKDIVLKKYPFLDGFLEKEISTARGTARTLDIGFHYSLKIGYKF